MGNSTHSKHPTTSGTAILFLPNESDAISKSSVDSKVDTKSANILFTSIGAFYTPSTKEQTEDSKKTKLQKKSQEEDSKESETSNDVVFFVPSSQEIATTTTSYTPQATTPVTVKYATSSTTTPVLETAATKTSSTEKLIKKPQQKTATQSATQEDSSEAITPTAYTVKSSEKTEDKKTENKTPEFQWSSSGDYDLPDYSGGTVDNSTTGTGQRVIQFAASKIGKRNYTFGATGQNGKYDCSGLAYKAYEAAGKTVPRSTDGWINSGRTPIGKFDGKPGDVIIQWSSGSKSGKHLQIIEKNLGNGKYQCIAAANRRDGIKRTTYNAANSKSFINIYRGKNGAKLIKKNGFK